MNLNWIIIGKAVLYLRVLLSLVSPRSHIVILSKELSGCIHTRNKSCVLIVGVLESIRAFNWEVRSIQSGRYS